MMRSSGSPGGGAELGDADAKAAAFREFKEETHMSPDNLSVVAGGPIFNDWGTQYFVCEYQDDIHSANVSRWRVKDVEVYGRKPVLYAYWMRVADAHDETKINKHRKHLLRRAMRKIAASRYAADPRTLALPAPERSKEGEEE